MPFFVLTFLYFVLIRLLSFYFPLLFPAYTSHFFTSHFLFNSHLIKIRLYSKSFLERTLLSNYYYFVDTTQVQPKDFPVLRDRLQSTWSRDGLSVRNVRIYHFPFGHRPHILVYFIAPLLLHLVLPCHHLFLSLPSFLLSFVSPLFSSSSLKVWYFLKKYSCFISQTTSPRFYSGI